MKITKDDWRDLQIIYDYLKIEDELPDKADAIVAGGAGPRIDIAERAAELYHKGRAPFIVFSGFKHPDFTENEAELLARAAIQLGVPEKAILLEPYAKNTGLNIILAAKILEERNIQAKNIVLVHRPFMTRRLKATAEKQWPFSPKPNFYATSIQGYDVKRCYNRDIKLGLGERMIWSMLGDYSRMTKYARLGFQTPQPHSQEAEAAFQRLKNRGFTAKPQNKTLSTEIFKND